MGCYTCLCEVLDLKNKTAKLFGFFLTVLIVVNAMNITIFANTNEYYEPFDYSDGVMAPNWKMGANTFTRGCSATVINRQYNLFYVGTKMNFPVTLTLPDGAFVNGKVLVSMEIEPVSMGKAKCPKLPSVYGMLDGKLVALTKVSVESGNLYYDDVSSGNNTRVKAPVTVTDGVAIKIGFVIDLEKKTYDFYLCSANGDVFSVSDLELLNKEVDNITGMELLFNGSSEPANYIVDNVHFRNYTEEEMTSFELYFSPNYKGNAMMELCNTLRSDDVVLKINKPDAIKNRKVVSMDETDRNITPVIRNSTTLVPIRFISEAFDAKIEFDNNDKSVTVLYKNIQMKVFEGSKKYLINGNIRCFDEPVEIKNGHTLVPVRAICELFGKKVLWDESGIVVISRWNKLFENEENISNINVILN